MAVFNFSYFHHKHVWIEAFSLASLLILATFLRLWHVELVPPGFHYDEAIDLKLGLDVAAGAGRFTLPKAGDARRFTIIWWRLCSSSSLIIHWHCG